MSIPALKYAKQLREAGERLGREGLSKRALELADQFDGSYKGAMILVGRMKALATAAKFDGYWGEKVDDGFFKELTHLTIPPRKPCPHGASSPATCSTCNPM